MKQNIKLKKSAKLTALSILFVLLLLAESVVNAVEHPEILAKNLLSTPEGFGVEVCLSATDRDVDNNGLDVYPGDTVTANIRVTGGSFEGAKLDFSFDTAAFCLETAERLTDGRATVVLRGMTEKHGMKQRPAQHLKAHIP